MIMCKIRCSIDLNLCYHIERKLICKQISKLNKILHILTDHDHSPRMLDKNALFALSSLLLHGT